jgi:hypothetical protein
MLSLTEARGGTVHATVVGDLGGCDSTGSHGPQRRGVWASAPGGVRTFGRYASATPAGSQQTIWLTQDTCAGTLVYAAKNTVFVRDLSHHKTIRLAAGHTYIARKP